MSQLRCIFMQPIVFSVTCLMILKVSKREERELDAGLSKGERRNSDSESLWSSGGKLQSTVCLLKDLRESLSISHPWSQGHPA